MIRLGYDANLGLPDGVDEILNELSRNNPSISFECESFHDIGSLIEVFERRECAMIFTPAGSLPYFRKPFDIIAEATFGPCHTTGLRSILRTRASQPPVTLLELSCRRMGCVNRYCTTSFWAPLILLSEGRQPVKNKPELIELNSFAEMLMAVSDGRIDGAMIWDAVTDLYHQESLNTQEGECVNDLPGPVLIANEQLGDIMSLNPKDLTAIHRNESGRGFFNGLTIPVHDRIQRFRDRMMHAKEVFVLEIP